MSGRASGRAASTPVARPGAEFHRANYIRLLRYLNSAGFGWHYQVETVAHALRLLGIQQLRKWVSAVATVGLADGKPAELITTALLRARLAARLASSVGMPEADLELFLGGLLSVMDAVMDEPLDRVVASLGLSPEQAAGLLRNEPPLGPVIELVIFRDRGDWPRIDLLSARLGAPPGAVQDAYTAAAAWAEASCRWPDGGDIRGAGRHRRAGRTEAELAIGPSYEIGYGHDPLENRTCPAQSLVPEGAMASDAQCRPVVSAIP